MKYIPLNSKTHYELLSSLLKIDDLIDYAIKNNIEAIGITDSNMFGTLEFINKNNKKNIKPIIGIEIKLDDKNFLLYAKNYNGYVNLCKIVSEKNINSINYDFLKNNNRDLICVLYNSLDYEYFKDIYDETFIAYKNKEEKVKALLVTSDIIFLKKTLYFNKEEKEYIKYLNMIKEGKTIENYIEDDNVDNSINFEIESFDYETIIDFVQKIDIELPKFELSLPEYSNNKEELLINLCKKGLIKRLIGKVTNNYVERLKYEISVIKEMGFINYFLIVYDFVLFAKKNNIVVGPGRGSAAGSLVSYSLGITDIDPIKYNLIFERFLNKDRVTMPDIDIDFEYSRRNEIINYVKEKYGINNVANIITFGTLLSKQVLRDVGRVLLIPTSEMDKIVKLVKDKETLSDLKNKKDFMSLINSKEEYKLLFKVSLKLENLKRHTSVHAAGVVISDEPLYNKLPLYKNGDTILTGYSMEYLEQIGLLKMDFLAIRDLSVIDNVRRMVKLDKGIDIDLNNIPLNDELTLKLFHNVDTVGIFQFESEGMKGFLKNLKIKNFDDIVSAIALYRPGPRDNIDSFIRRRNGKEKVDYLHPLLENTLKSTYGIIIYQEQIIEILKIIGGFSYSEADIIRRAMSKKKENIILESRNKFISGSIKNGINQELSAHIYDLVLKFSNYGFNKSHSVAYSLVAYKMAYLKAHYREYFMVMQLNLVIGNEIKTKEYIDETRVGNIDISLIDINLSENKYIVKEGRIIFPLTIIKSVGETISKEIINERNENGIFKNYIDAVSRIYNIGVNKNIIENLILSGCFNFGINKKTMVENLDNVINYANLIKDLDKTLVTVPQIIEYSEYNNDEIMSHEYNMFGFYIKNHPVTKYKRDNMCLTKNIEQYFDKYISIIGLIENKKEVISKKKEEMCFLTISDEYKKVSVVIFPKTYIKYKNINKGNIIKIKGKVEKRMDNYQIIANEIEVLK